MKDIVITGFKRSFYPGSYTEKRAYVRRIINYYDKLEAEHGVIALEMARERKHGATVSKRERLQSDSGFPH